MIVLGENLINAVWSALSSQMFCKSSYWSICWFSASVSQSPSIIDLTWKFIFIYRKQAILLTITSQSKQNNKLYDSTCQEPFLVPLPPFHPVVTILIYGWKSGSGTKKCSGRALLICILSELPVLLEERYTTYTGTGSSFSLLKTGSGTSDEECLVMCMVNRYCVGVKSVYNTGSDVTCKLYKEPEASSVVTVTNLTLKVT